jgi:hypothetical protein
MEGVLFMYRIAFLSLIFVLPVLAVPPTEKREGLKTEVVADKFAGIYDGLGEESPGKTYSAVVVIRKELSVYTVQWSLGGSVILGIGQVVDGKLAVGWAQSKGDQVLRGCTVYESVQGGLKGAWVSIPGDGSRHKEDLKLLKALSPGE